MDKKGFSLTELLIVVAVISILAMIAVPAYIGQGKRATRNEAYTNLQNLRLLEEQVMAESGAYATSQGTCAKNNNNIAAIQGVLPGFKPGSGLNYSYCIEQNLDINGNAVTPCFRARAFGNTGSRVVGDAFAIDCNNNRNF